ncbi:hypothetical protein HRW23_01585 [Streptomyces lunaelactis]|uniref:hypothetical protein n=1 Tax=Streptomyces lunaelactis TaxID=1535768 RepID=UPI001585C859|nr:hypothetical protein [Streptomyces lunaelactis]NUK03454.1 hypothetical protein [Streptomyces lunaelactis]NUK17344.1 hypothetical protein [Streptomyces lunaelactis]NUK36249.1 hypothetical protein [Streptomyces lunaelactis]NUK41235.1 hypothetical protein [Streptomyces lunaelactis]NUK56623.1 hypothetical protein [Streptomyces lunaelactis]
MPGDVTSLTTAGGDGAEVRKGPRHAAPRKSLLTKLQRPAGKAIALAAMPTAVFVGMSLTPKLALAEDKDIPFAPGPCVTRSDEPVESESPSPSESAKPSESPSEKPDPSPSASEGDKPADEPTPGTTPSASESAAPKTAATPAPAPTPSETKTTNPLDPLGVGDAIKDLLDGPDSEPTASPTPTASATSKPSEEPSEEPSATPSTEPSEKPTTKPTDTVDDAVGDTADKTKDAIKDAADKVGATTEELDEAVKSLDPKLDVDVPDGAKPPFPCPTADPKALAEADLEQGRPLLPDDPWILESSLLTLKGLDYHGIVEVKTGSGKIKKVLKFTASSVDIKDLHQLVVGPNGTTAHVEADKGSTSTIRNGEVTMYTEELKGNLFGLIPITFSPETPPPLNVPFAFFTNVKVTQAGQFGGTLTVPGLSNYFTGGNN